MAWDREKERKAAGGMHIGIGIFSVVFAVFWCIMAASMGAWFMLIFGIPFTGLMVFRLVMSIKMMDREKPKEPWEGGQSYTGSAGYTPSGTARQGSYCPYCGSAVEETFEYCPKCGRKLHEYAK